MSKPIGRRRPPPRSRERRQGTELRLCTARMVLRPLAASDRAEFVRVHEASHTLYQRWIPALAPGEGWDQLFTRQWAKARKGAWDGTQLRLVGELPDGRIAGFFNLSEIVRGAFHNAYASWSVNLEVAGQGYATEGVLALLSIAFAAAPGMGLHRVQANIVPANAASIRIAEKTGFRREGLALRYLRIAGEWQDHLMYAKLADEHDVSGFAAALAAGRG